LPLYNDSLPTPDQRDWLDVVLVSPRNPLNIGAAARAMANFGFSRLTVVAPFDPHWREAKSAIGAPDLLQNAKRAECLADAVAGCSLVIGTGTLTYRKPEQPVAALPALPALLAERRAPGARAALVFGPEKHGLTREDLALCHLMVEIPTDPAQPSMNLGQAVAVCLYELACHGQAANSQPLPPPSLPAVSGHLDLVAGVVEQAMAASGYSPRAMQAANRHDLTVLLRRLSLSERDARRVLGLFRRILWRLKRTPADNRK